MGWVKNAWWNVWFEILKYRSNWLWFWPFVSHYVCIKWFILSVNTIYKLFIIKLYWNKFKLDNYCKSSASRDRELGSTSGGVPGHYCHPLLLVGHTSHRRMGQNQNQLLTDLRKFVPSSPSTICDNKFVAVHFLGTKGIILVKYPKNLSWKGRF